MGSFYVPARTPEDWRPLLGDPGKQWKPGRSAMALATCWHEADDFPASVRRVLQRSAHPVFHDLLLLLALPEHKTPLPPVQRGPSQTDLLVLARTGEGLVSIAVEGKVDEPFGDLVSEWLTKDLGSDGGAGKRKRLAYLCGELERTEDVVGTVRYQLLHRTVAAVVEARRFGAATALMLVHSFSPEDAGFGDFKRFAALLGAAARVDTIVAAGRKGSVDLYLGWVREQEQSAER